MCFPVLPYSFEECQLKFVSLCKHVQPMPAWHLKLIEKNALKEAEAVEASAGIIGAVSEATSSDCVNPQSLKKVI